MPVSRKALNSSKQIEMKKHTDVTSEYFFLFGILIATLIEGTAKIFVSHGEEKLVVWKSRVHADQGSYSLCLRSAGFSHPTGSLQ